MVISKRCIVDRLNEMKTTAHYSALIIRSQKSEFVKGRNWSGTNPPYFTTEAINHIASLGCAHLVVDLPSVDREDDEGSPWNLDADFIDIHSHVWQVS